MARINGAGQWVSELCIAFGENPNEVRSIDLHCAVNAAVTVTIEKFVQKDNTKVIEVIKKVIWVEDPEESEK